MGVAQFTYGGSTTNNGGDCFELTPATIGSLGYVYRNAPISLNDTFHLKFRVNLGTNNGGGDGIMFVLRDTLQAPFLGSSGNSLGFDDPALDTNSLGIEIDTHEDPGKNDIAADHVAILKNGSTDHGGANSLVNPVQAVATNTNIEDGNDHTFQIIWSPTSQTLTVSIDCQRRITYNADIKNTIFDGDANVYWGLLGATGGNINVQSFCIPQPLSSLVTPLPAEVDVCKNDTGQLDAGDTLAKYLWSPSVGLTANNIPDPKTFAIETTEYTVRQTYFCDTMYDTTVVNIIPPNFQTSASISNVSCKDVCDGVINLSIVGGTAGINGYDYDWSTGATSQDINMLCDSFYIVTVQDVELSSPNYLCHRIDTYYVTEPSYLNASIINPTKTKCPNSPNCDAEAKGVGSGGTPPYSYTWTSGETNEQAQFLCAGINMVTVTDANGCQAFDTVTIDVPDSIITIGFGDTLICINSIAAIAASSTGGTPPFSYVWREGSLAGPVVSISSAEAVNPVVTTEYFVQSFDGNGCSGDTGLVTVKVRPQLDVVFENRDTICPYDTIDVTAIGIGGDSSYTYAWSTGTFGNTITVSPDRTEWYTVTVNDVCGTPFTSDSVKIQVGGYPDLRPHIAVEDDTICAGKSIYMIASATGGFRGPEEYRFTWLHNGSHADIQFETPKVTTSYTVSVEDLCLSKSDTQTVTIFVGNKLDPHFEFDKPVACKEGDVVIRISDFSARHKYTWIIDTFGIIEDYKYDSLVYRFSNTGCYNFELQTESQFGCYSDTLFECGVQILENPVASFDHFPENPSNVEPMIDFVNTSIATDNVHWVIGQDTIFGDSTLRYEFDPRDEPYTVTLFTANDLGCFDSVSTKVTYFEKSIIRYPNAFTPNADGINDLFFVYSEGIQLEDFNLEIFDRNGSQVFRTQRQSQGWDGRMPNGVAVQLGTYFMILHYRDDEKIERVIHDEIHVLPSIDSSF